MQDLVLVEGSNRVRNLPRNPRRLARLEGLRELIERLPLDVFHEDEGPLAQGADLVDLHDPWVRHVGEQVGLAHEARQEQGVGVVDPLQLEGDLASTGVDVANEVDRAHSTGSERTNDRVGAEVRVAQCNSP